MYQHANVRNRPRSLWSEQYFWLETLFTNMIVHYSKTNFRCSQNTKEPESIAYAYAIIAYR